MMYRLPLPWATWQGAEIHTVATHAFWLCRHEVLLVLMLLENSMHMVPTVKKSSLFSEHSSVDKDPSETAACTSLVSLSKGGRYSVIALHVTWKVLGFRVRCIISVLTTLSTGLWVQIAIIKSLLHNQYRNSMPPFSGKPDFPKHDAL